MTDTPPRPATSSDTGAQGKGVMKALYEGLRTLVVIDEKLARLGKDADNARKIADQCSQLLNRLTGKLEEMDKRLDERAAATAHRLDDIDKRIDLQISLRVEKAVKQYVEDSEQARYIFAMLNDRMGAEIESRIEERLVNNID
ncbi:hypothetical protein J2R99_000469 [Rhodopseudomonas julia]|uniref:Uncharacterized protein n=1 Tax=Rhodopseudomonas julia TaxID=200617 RepID=A0ABU0C4L9_9BRAD|nr:hypothetical protein [Rhodopseudomonas julia]MDQ0324620.1 hypothetical protein [Rhodopseudomonas julia]